jgi:hypothetical protein
VLPSRVREISAVALAGLCVIHCSKFGFAADVSEEASFISVLLGALLESSFLKRPVIDLSKNFMKECELRLIGKFFVIGEASVL